MSDLGDAIRKLQARDVAVSKLTKASEQWDALGDTLQDDVLGVLVSKKTDLSQGQWDFDQIELKKALDIAIAILRCSGQ